MTNSFAQWRLQSESVHSGDPGFFEGILDNVPLTSLIDSVKAMDGVNYFHGARQCELTFRFDSALPAIDEALMWAKNHHIEENSKLLQILDIERPTAEQKLAAIRLWTDETVCYVVTSLLRDRNRTVKSLIPILTFCRLLFGALNSLPDNYIFEGTLYRAENGVHTTLDQAKTGTSFAFFAPTSFSVNAQVIRTFKDIVTPRTVFELEDGVGYLLGSLSKFPEEGEVLLMGVAILMITDTEKFDSQNKYVMMGEQQEGLHYIKARIRPGVALLSDSPVKLREKAAFDRKTQELLVPARGLDLEYDPLSPEELAALDRDLDDLVGDDIQERSELGSGSFGTTYRMKIKGGFERFAVKVVSKREMRKLSVKPEQILREFGILRNLRHRHVIQYMEVVQSKRTTSWSWRSLRQARLLC